MILIAQNKVPLIVSQYIETCVVPKASGLLAAAAWGSIFLSNRLINNFFKVEKNKEFLKMTEIMNTDENIDIDNAYETLKFIIDKSKKIEVFGWVIDDKDIEKIYEIAKEMV